MQKIKHFIILFLSFLSLIKANDIRKTTGDHSTCDCHNRLHVAPIGVMASHTHQQDELMLSYKFSYSEMSDLYKGTDKVKSPSGYMMTPYKMAMQMHMLKLMYAPSDDWSLMLMSNLSNHTMTMINPMGVSSKMDSSGIGDTSLTVLHSIIRKPKTAAHFSLGVSLPTGSINDRSDRGALLPYNMQRGSGTFDFIPSYTYTHYHRKYWTLGAQLRGCIRMGNNSRDYRLGDKAEMTTWMIKSVSSKLSLSSRLLLSFTNSVSAPQNGGSYLINPMTTLGSDPKNTGSTHLDLFIGLRYALPNGMVISTELGKRVLQNVKGTQLGNRLSIQGGLQTSW